MIDQQLNIKNCTEYLQGEYFTNIKFEKEENGCLFFYADDECGQRKYIHFDPSYNNAYDVCVCIFDNVSQQWHMYELLNE
jgi:hypothetical protein